MPLSAPRNNTGGIDPYEQLAADNIVLVPVSPDINRGVSLDTLSGKTMEFHLSVDKAATEAPVVEFFIITKVRGEAEVVKSQTGHQEPDDPNNWMFDLKGEDDFSAAPISEEKPDAKKAQASKQAASDSKVMGWFARAIINGRIVGYCASTLTYGKYAMNPAEMVNHNVTQEMTTASTSSW